MQRERQRRLSRTATFQHHSFRVYVREARRPSLLFRPLTSVYIALCALVGYVCSRGQAFQVLPRVAWGFVMSRH